jgi:hypothetical protein
MKVVIVFGMVALGFVLLALSFAWVSMFPGSSTWTQEKAARSTEIKGKMHNLAFIVNAPNPRLHAGQDLGQLKAEYEQLRKENEQLNADFESAYNSPRTTANVLKWTGLSFAVLGLIGWYAVKQTS